MDYKFIYKTIVEENIIDKTLLWSNDIYEKYNATVSLNGELIVCVNPEKRKVLSKKLVKESYQEYLEYISKHNFEKEKWIYNIINGEAEQDSILFKDSEQQLVIIPSYTWDQTNKNKLHILGIHTNLEKRCLRDLTLEDVSWLKNALKVGAKTILEKYGLTKDKIKTFIHYEPSSYQLHIHFMNTEYVEGNSSCEYSHEVNSVIFNLQLDSDYYKKIKLLKRV